MRIVLFWRKGDLVSSYLGLCKIHREFCKSVDPTLCSPHPVPCELWVEGARHNTDRVLRGLAVWVLVWGVSFQIVYS